MPVATIPARRRADASTAAVSVIVVCCAAVGFIAVPVDSWVSLGLGLVLLVFPVVSLRADRSNGRPWSMRSLLLVDLALGYGVGGIYATLSPPSDVRFRTEPEALAVAMLIGLMTALGLTIGYRLAPRGKGRSGTNVLIERGIRGLELPAALLMLEGIGWSARIGLVLGGDYFHISDSVSSSPLRPFLTPLSLFPLFAVCIVAAKRWSLGRRLGFAWVLVAIEMVWYLPGGSREETLTVLVALALVRAQLGLRISRKLLIVCATLAILLFPLLSNYRQSGDDYATDVKYAASTAASETFSGTGLDPFVTGVESVLGRFSDVLDAAVAVQLRIDGDRVGGPFSEYLITAAIPRSLAPDKPDPGSYGNQFGRATGILQPNDFFTSLAVGQGLYFWMVGGFLLLIIGMLASGALYRLLDEALAASNLPLLALRSALGVEIALSVGTIWPLGFVGLVKSLTVLLISLASVAVAARLLSPQGPSMTSREVSD